MFKVPQKNISLNIFYLCKLTASIREWCREYFTSRCDKTWDLIFLNRRFEYSNNTPIISKFENEIIQVDFSGIRRH